MLSLILQLRPTKSSDWVHALIIDGHTHLIHRFPDQNVVDIKFDWDSLDFWLSSEPESKCVLMPELTQFCDSVALNREFFRSLSVFPKKDRVFPFLWIHPHQLEHSSFKEFAFFGFKFHPSISGTTLDAIEETLELCDKYRKPVLIHCGRDEKSRIDYVLKVNERYDKISFICAHLGGLAVDLVIRALEKTRQADYLDNVFFDTSGCFNPALVKKAVEILGDDKIVFGSDRPFQDYQISLYTINSCKFGAKTRQNILFKNIERILLQ
jgi:predicted TIM-barrel fold metal-dependent hydrolase